LDEEKNQNPQVTPPKGAAATQAQPGAGIGPAPAAAPIANWQKFAALLGPKTPENPSACGYSTEPEYDAARLIRAVRDYRLDDPRALAWYVTGKDPGPEMEKSV
jgi:hypothetical protein